MVITRQPVTLKEKEALEKVALMDKVASDIRSQGYIAKRDDAYGDIKIFRQSSGWFSRLLRGKIRADLVGELNVIKQDWAIGLLNADPKVWDMNVYGRENQTCMTNLANYLSKYNIPINIQMRDPAPRTDEYT